MSTAYRGERGPSRMASAVMASLIRLSWLGAVCAMAGTVLGFLGEVYWFFGLFTPWRWQYAVMLLSAALTMLAVKKRRRAIVLVPFLLANSYVLVPYYWPAASGQVPADTFRAVYLNVHSSNVEFDRVRDGLVGLNADFIMLAEVTAGWVNRMQPLKATHPYALEYPRADNFGIALYSRHPFVRAEKVELGHIGLPAVRVSFGAPANPVELITLHAIPPINEAMSQDRNRQIVTVATLLERPGSGALVMGDFNAVPWSAPVRRLREAAGLSDCNQGRGLRLTWPSFNWLLLIPIDNCLYRGPVNIVNAFTLPDLGSDHYGIAADFSVWE